MPFLVKPSQSAMSIGWRGGAAHTIVVEADMTQNLS